MSIYIEERNVMFCNQCGTQVPDQAAVCPNCGANIGQNPVSSQSMNAGQVPQQPVQNMGVGQVPQQPAQNMGAGQMPQQPVQNMGADQVPQQSVQNMGAGQIPQQPVQNAGMGTGYGQPGMQQPNQQMYNGAPMPGYGQPKANPLAFITAVHPGEPFPLKNMFSIKTLLSKVTTIDLIGAISALVMFISVFLPFLSAYDESVSMIKLADGLDIHTTWLVIVLSLGALVLYALRMEMLGFLVSVLNVIVFVHIWTLGAAFKSMIGGHFGVGFYFYLLTTIAAVIAPFVWGKIKKNV